MTYKSSWSATVVGETELCEIILGVDGFYARCKSPNCNWSSENYLSEWSARVLAEDHESEDD